MYDFDKIIDRKGTDSLKFDCAKLRGKKGDELSLWVADMDFPVAQKGGPWNLRIYGSTVGLF